MKYVWILLVVVIMVRIDVVMRFFDKTSDKIQSAKNSAPVSHIEGAEIIPLENNLNSTSSPRVVFFSILRDFLVAPDAAFKEQAIEILKKNPALFTDKIDTELEAAIYKWRDLLNQKNKVTLDFLMELLKNLRGENLEMVKRFFSYAIDVDLEDFLTVYSKSTDTNCILMSYLGDALPIEEKFNELSERLTVLDAFLKSDKSPSLKAYAQKCQLVLKLEVDKLNASLIPLEDPSESGTESIPTSAPGTNP